MFLPVPDASSWKRCNKTAKTFRGLYHRRVGTVRLYAVIPSVCFVCASIRLLLSQKIYASGQTAIPGNKKGTSEHKTPKFLSVLCLSSNLEYRNLVLEAFHILIQYTCRIAQLLYMLKQLISHIINSLGTSRSLFDDIRNILYF